MENIIEIRQNILNEFLNRWTRQNVEQLILKDYVDVKNKDTFCYWVETETRNLGSIKGLIGSIKFGIYKRKSEKKDERPKNYENDDEYSWQKHFGKTRQEAFENVKKEILQIIDFSQTGNFKAIDELKLPRIFRWKVAYLYSNERLLPIFSQEVLHRIANGYGLKVTNKTDVSKIQEFVLQKKPVDITIQEFSEKLWKEFGEKEKKQSSNQKSKIAKTNRKSVSQKNTNPQFRSGTKSVIARQTHNLLQNELKRILVDKHGEDVVDLELNYIDVKLNLSDSVVFYEVKSDSTAEDCIKKALGQVLAYAFKNEDSRKKKVVVVGQYPPSDNAKNFIKYIKENLLIEFDYEQIELNKNL